MAAATTRKQVAILLSCYNGSAFLLEQLQSLTSQTHMDWCLWWRDDGSSDDSVALLEQFMMTRPNGQCIRVEAPHGRSGAAASFLALLHLVTPTLGDQDSIAFADQDDVWLPDKLSRGVAALAESTGPTLYCARQILTDSALCHIGLSSPPTAGAGFPACLTQNIATGCTVMMNAEAVRLVAASTPPTATWHDWWCYMIVSAAGGKLVQDPTPSMLYRQHSANQVGIADPFPQRAWAALRRGPAPYMFTLRQNLAALRAQPDLITPASRALVQQLYEALESGPRQRLAALRIPKLRRRTLLETVLFRLWFLLG